MSLRRIHALMVQRDTISLLIDARVGAKRFGALGAVVTYKEDDRRSVCAILTDVLETLDELIEKEKGYAVEVSDNQNAR